MEGSLISKIFVNLLLVAVISVKYFNPERYFKEANEL